MTVGLLLLLTTSSAITVNESYAIASPPQPPSWLQPGDYIVYNQTFTIKGLTASILVNDTILSVNGGADMRIQRYDPHIPAGFAEPGLVAPYDSKNESGAVTTVHTTNGTEFTTVSTASVFTSDLTMFITPDLVSATNATLVPINLPGSSEYRIQAWKVDEPVLDTFVEGLTIERSPNPSLVWFEQSTLMKVRESNNETDSSGNYLVSIETIAETNIPQLQTALSSNYVITGSQVGTAQNPSNPTIVVGVVAILIAVASAGAAYYLKKRGRPSASQIAVWGFAIHRVHCAHEE